MFGIQKMENMDSEVEALWLDISIFFVLFKMGKFSFLLPQTFLIVQFSKSSWKDSQYPRSLGTISRGDLWVIVFLSFPLVCVNATVSMFDFMQG